MKKVLVLGAGGQIARWVIRMLAAGTTSSLPCICAMSAS